MSRAGIVTVAGKPNAGKSTLLNRLVGEKLAITSPKPQSTRHRVVGLRTADDTQMVVLDTPGLLDPKDLLHEAMRGASLAAVRDADVIVYVVDANALNQGALRAWARSRVRAVSVDSNPGDEVDAGVTEQVSATDTERNTEAADESATERVDGEPDDRAAIADATGVPDAVIDASAAELALQGLSAELIDALRRARQPPDAPTVATPVAHATVRHGSAQAASKAAAASPGTVATRAGAETPAESPADALPWPTFLEAASLERAPRARVLTVLNKSDILPADIVSALQQLGPDVLTMSALTGDGIDPLVSAVTEQLPESPYLYPADEISTLPMRFFCAEFVRETALEQLGDELPHALACAIDEYREGSSPLYIRAVLYVERESQKAIVIGAGGQRIKQLGRAARVKIEQFVGEPVYLDLWVKVLANWRRKRGAVTRLGYGDPNANHPA